MTPTLPALDLREPTPGSWPAEHYPQLWPTPRRSAGNAPLFLLAVSPLRLLALGTLGATSSPGRFLISVVVCALFGFSLASTSAAPYISDNARDLGRLLSGPSQ